MPDNVKMSLHNALTIVALIVACAVSYNSLNSATSSTRDDINRIDAVLEKVVDIQHRQDLGIQRNSDRYETILSNQGETKQFIIDATRVMGRLEIVDGG